MASFQAKIGSEMPRKRRNKNCLSVPFIPDGKYKTTKKEKKIKKIPLWLHFKPKLDGKGRLKRDNKNYRSVPYQPDA